MTFKCVEPDFTMLPTELLVKIFKYLPVADRTDASLTCWRWYEVSKYLGFVQKKCLHLIGIEFDDFTSPVADLLRSCFYFPVLKLTRVKLNAYSKFWAKFGPFVQEITFEKCMIWRERIISVLKYMPNLRIARFVECDLLRDDLFLNWKFFENGVVKIYFPSIEHLSLANNTFSKLQFNVMVDMMPNLTKVDLSNCCRNIDAIRKTQLLNCILTFIQHRQNELKSLNLSGVPVDDIFLRGVVRAQGLMLQELTFTYLEKIPQKLPAIIDLFQMQTEIRIIDLSESTGITDYCIDQIVRNMPDLRVVKLAGCCGVSDYGVTKLFKLHHLEVLDLSKCRISRRGILDGATSKIPLKELYLELLSPLDDECIVKICTSFTNLKILNIGGSASCMTYYALQHIFYNLNHLEQLNLERSTKLTDAGFTGIDLPHKTFAIWDIEETFSIERLKKLKVLKVSGCYKLTDFSLRYAFRFMELKELSLSRCHQLSKQGIEKLVENCPALEYLDLSECPNINDQCVELIAQHLKRLSTLKLANCPLISEVGLSYLSQYCKNLKYLYVRGCFKLPPDISERLANITTLRQVYKS
ncbi:F-box and leucine-rich repeat protein 13-like isoform X3 [Armigeres subalbatus]|uniref:F-box and leucine-rich repeat protein 13-like isoform X3 n=1 Tax=Armigeres subalbatus TaxID=124917 RepID=UPI002ED6BB7D